MQHSGKTLTLAALAIVLLALGLRVAAYDPWAQFHADEFYQYLEQGHRLAAGYGAVPWEWREGVRNALIPQLLAGPMALGTWLAPQGLLAVHLARITFAALCLAALAGAWGIGAAQSRRHALAALLVAAVWFDGVRFSVYVLSESLAAALIVCGAALVMHRRHLPLAGFLLALGVLVRLQYAPFAAVFVVLAAGRDWRLWRALIAGGLAALVLGIASDMANDQVPLRWIWANFAQNIGAGRAARFGVTGPLEYLNMLFAGLGPFAPLVLIASLFAGRRFWPLLAAAVVTIFAHSLIGHKEYRFIWLAVFTLLTLAAIGSVNLLDLWLTRRPAAARFALPALCLGWCAIALAAMVSTGGAASVRGGGAITRAAHDIARLPQVCGLAVPLQWHNNVIAAYLRRDVAVYEIPEAWMQGKAALPPPITGAANAILAPAQPAPGYAAQSCHSEAGTKACLWIRPGTCEPAPARRFERQTYMEANDL